MTAISETLLQHSEAPEAAASEPDLNAPELYINRELSLLEFNRRVLEQAKDAETPLLERLRFLCISCTNLDEFFEIRVAGLKQRLEIGSAAPGPDAIKPADLLAAIATTTAELVAEQYRVLNADLIPALAAENIRFVRRTDWTDGQNDWLREYFRTEIVPVLSPIALDPMRPVPKILNKSLNFILKLHGNDAFGRPVQRALVQAPRSLPRLIRLPPELPDTGVSDFVFLSSVIHAFVHELFTGMEIEGCFQFRVTRNSDLYVDDEEVDDLMRALEGELTASRYGAAVRLEIAEGCSPELSDYLLRHFHLEAQDLYPVDGPVNLNRLAAVYDMIDRPDLKYPSFTPGVPASIRAADDIFEAIRRQDILLHHPFESFAPVMDFISRAAKDPAVLAIKQTLYRTGPDSSIVESLVQAARAGKEVTVVIELRARFDEAANIQLANALQEAGAHVVYGVVGYKTHAKMALVVRREGGRLRRYAHLGTGNYHPKTTRAYTDYGLLTADEEIGEDIHELFLQLTSLMKMPRLKQVCHSPFTLADRLHEFIQGEIDQVANGGTGHIIVKVNALVEPEIIRALYRASIAGVHVDLLVRGICCLRPGMPGVSDNIRVHSIIGRFLEHTRVYYFHNGGDEVLWCASADWMDRNLFRRVELMFPLNDPDIRQRVISDLDIYLEDNLQAWQLDAAGRYGRVSVPADGSPRSAQMEMLRRWAESV
ncbi:MAG: polyphosphate kinase 1 [Gammaproteobacteria bacterium]|nr:polyphosphate kinase 1 [Gammaproteobacteria bacterium]